MNIKELIRANILYYYITAMVYILLMLAALYFFPTDGVGSSQIDFYIVIPIVSLILGFLAGGVNSCAKWAFPLYVALLCFCMTVFIYGFEDWTLVLLGFLTSFAGVTVRHLILRNREVPQ
jgi:hypothetical protein